MILGLSVYAFTVLHVIISLIGIAAGVVVVHAMLRSESAGGWTAIFLAATVLTTLTGFLFPITVFTPALGVGIISTVTLAIALVALYVFHLAGPWRLAYIASALFAFYLNAFVAVVQAFQKIPWVHALAPTQTEPAFVAAQTLLLILFAVVGFLVARRFHPPASFAA